MRVFETAFNTKFSSSLDLGKAGGAALVPVVDGQLLQVLEGWEQAKKKWEPFAGAKDRGESAAATLFRETAEELGIILLPEHVGHMHPYLYTPTKFPGSFTLVVFLNATGFSPAQFGLYVQTPRKGASNPAVREMGMIRTTALSDQSKHVNDKNSWYDAPFFDAFHSYLRDSVPSGNKPLHALEFPIAEASRSDGGKTLELARSPINLGAISNLGELIGFWKSCKSKTKPHVDGTDWLGETDVMARIEQVTTVVAYMGVYQNIDDKSLVDSTPIHTMNTDTGISAILVTMGKYGEENGIVKGDGSHFYAVVFNERSRNAHVFDSLTKRDAAFASNIVSRIQALYGFQGDFNVKNHTSAVQRGASCGCWAFFFILGYAVNYMGCVDSNDNVDSTKLAVAGNAESLWSALNQM